VRRAKMAVVAFIEPPQRDVIEKILSGHRSGADHRFASVPVGGLWRSAAARAPPTNPAVSLPPANA
jgi:hypothetical protein